MAGARRRSHRLLLGLVVSLITSPRPLFSERVWLEVPFVSQEEKACGAASVSMLLKYWSQKGAPVKPVEPDLIFDLLYSEKEKGIPAEDLVGYLQELGFRVYPVQAEWEDLENHLSRGRPILVALAEGGSRGPFHYVVVVGFDPALGVVLVNDPARRGRLPFPRQEFEKAWIKTGNWALLALPSESAAPAPREPPNMDGIESGVAADPEPRGAAEQNYRAGMALAREGRWEEARGTLLQGQQQAPREVRFPLELAGIALKGGDRHAAREHLSRAIALDPSNQYAYHFLGTIHYLEGNLEAAIKMWNRAGRPQIHDVRLDLPKGVDPVLVERALRVSPTSLLSWEDLLHSQARIEQLSLFTRQRFELLAGDGDSFDLWFRGDKKSLWMDHKLGRLVPLLAGLPFQTLALTLNGLDGAAGSLSSSFRWHPERRRLFASFSGLPGADPAVRYRLHIDARQENWDVSTSTRGAFSENPEFELSWVEAGVHMTFVPAARWKWSTGVLLSHRRFASANLPDDSGLFSPGVRLKTRSTVEHQLLRLPEKGFTVTGQGRSEFGGTPAGAAGPFSRLSGALDMRWEPLSLRGNTAFSASAQGGSAWGRIPFDELFILGLERDNDLWMRGHVGTHRGRKGSAPMGRRYVLFKSELERRFLKNHLVEFWAGPFLDSGKILDDRGYFGTEKWLWDTGLQFQLRLPGGPALMLFYGKNLRTGQDSFYAAITP